MKKNIVVGTTILVLMLFAACGVVMAQENSLSEVKTSSTIDGAWVKSVLDQEGYTGFTVSSDGKSLQCSRPDGYTVYLLLANDNKQLQIFSYWPLADGVALDNCSLMANISAANGKSWWTTFAVEKEFNSLYATSYLTIGDQGISGNDVAYFTRAQWSDFVKIYDMKLSSYCKVGKI